MATRKEKDNYSIGIMPAQPGWVFGRKLDATRTGFENISSQRPEMPINVPMKKGPLEKVKVWDPRREHKTKVLIA